MLGQENEDVMTSPMRPLRPAGREASDEDDRSRDSSDPPPPYPGGELVAARDRAEHAVKKARLALVSSDDAADDAAQAVAGVNEIKTLLGNSPDPVLRLPGSGLFGAMHTLVTKVDAIDTKLTVQEQAAQARRGSLNKLLGWVAAPSIALLVAAVAAWLAGFHR